MDANKDTADKILSVATDLFAAKGFKGTSIRDIAKISGSTSSNIYYHFGSKEGLLSAILERSTRRIVVALRQVVEKDIDPLERFRLLLRTHLDLLLDFFRKESKVLFLDEEHLARLSKHFQVEILDIYRSELQNLRSLGYVKYKDLTVLAFNIFGVINWHVRWYKPEGRMSLGQVTDEMLTFVLYGALTSSLCEIKSND